MKHDLVQVWRCLKDVKETKEDLGLDSEKKHDVFNLFEGAMQFLMQSS